MNSREYYIVRQRLAERGSAALSELQRLHAFRSEKARGLKAAQLGNRVCDRRLEQIAARPNAKPPASSDARPVYVAFFQRLTRRKEEAKIAEARELMRYVLLSNGKGILSRHTSVAQAKLRMAAYNTSVAGQKDPATLYDAAGKNWRAV